MSVEELKELLQTVTALNTQESKDLLIYGIKSLTERLQENKKLQNDYNSFTENMKKLSDVQLMHQAVLASEEQLIDLLNICKTNLQKLQNNDLFSVAYSSVIILYRDVQTP